MTFLDNINLLGKEIHKLIEMGNKDETVIVNKTCSCGRHYIYWDIDDCKTNSIGIWFDCFDCGSTMVNPNKETLDKLNKFKKEKQNV